MACKVVQVFCKLYVVCRSNYYLVTRFALFPGPSQLSMLDQIITLFFKIKETGCPNGKLISQQQGVIEEQSVRKNDPWARPA